MKEYPKMNILFGHKHSKKYKRPIISDFLTSKDEHGNIIKRHSDLYLLLRQEHLKEAIGTEELRKYVDNLYQPQVTRPTFTDEELFQLIEPKDVDNITDAYNFARFLQDNDKKIRDKYNKIVESKKQVNEYFKSNPRLSTSE